MQSLLDLIFDIDSVTGKLVTTAVVVAVGTMVGTLTGRLLARRTGDRHRRYYVRKGTNLVAGFARWRKDELTRRVLDRFDRSGISVASQTADLTLRSAPGEGSP